MRNYRILVLMCIINISYGKLPPTIPVCRRNHPNLSQCIANSINLLKPQLSTGDFGGGYVVPKIEPLFVKEMNFGENVKDGMDFRLIDANIYGISNFKIDKLRSNINDLKFDALITIPKLTTSAKYIMKFNFFGNQLKTNGDFYIVHENMKIIIPLRLRRINKNGVDGIKMDPIAVQILQYKVTQTKFTNLFGGNKVLEEIIQALFSSNSDYLFKFNRPKIEESLSKVFTDIAYKIMESTTFDEMFPV